MGVLQKRYATSTRSLFSEINHRLTFYLSLYLTHYLYQFDTASKGIVYIKVSCKKVKEHRVTCRKTACNPNATCREKGIANQVMREMEGKEEEDWHTVWYLGESGRTLPERMKEGYPKIMEMFGVTHKMQLSESPQATGRYTRLLESVVAGSIQAATNRTVELAAEANDVEFKDLSFLSF